MCCLADGTSTNASAQPWGFMQTVCVRMLHICPGGWLCVFVSNHVNKVYVCDSVCLKDRLLGCELKET